MPDSNPPRKPSLRDTIEPKSDQLNYDDVTVGPITVRVVKLSAGSPEQPVIVHVVDAETGAEMRPYKPCKSMRRVLVATWGDKGKDWIGQSMTLFGDPSVKWAGVEIGGIRISHVSGIEKPMKLKLTTSKGKRSDYTVAPLVEAKDADQGR